MTQPTFSLLTSAIQRVDVTEAMLGIETIQLTGATEDIAAFNSKVSSTVHVSLGSVITRLESFHVPAGSYGMVKVKIGKLNGDPMLGRSILIRGSVLADGVVTPFTFTSALSTIFSRRFAPPIEIPANTGELVQVVALAIDRSKWFLGANGHLLDPRNSANQREIENNISNSITPFVGQFFLGFAVTPSQDAQTAGIAIHSDGWRVQVLSDVNGRLNGAVFASSHGDAFTVFRGADGLPIRAVAKGRVVLFRNWTAASVDIALVGPNGQLHITRNVKASPDLISALRLSSGSPAAALSSSGSLSQSVASVSLPDVTLGEALKMGEDLLTLASAVSCLGTALVDPIVGAFVCATELLVSELVDFRSASNRELEATSTGVGLVGSTVECELDVFQKDLVGAMIDCAGSLAKLAKTILADAADQLRDEAAAITEAEQMLSPGPLIALSPASVFFNTAEGGADPSVQTVSITNSGGGTLNGLNASIGYSTGQPSDWLSASLSSTTAPSTLTLTATTGSLVAGTYSATVNVSSAIAGNSPRGVSVGFVVGLPTSQQIAFVGSVSLPSGAQSNAIYILDADGTNPRSLISVHNDAMLAWSPDGSKIAFGADYFTRDQDIWVVDATNGSVDSTEAVDLTRDLSSADIYPSWSPDGGKIAFVSYHQVPGFVPNVWVMNADGSGKTYLTNDESETPAWSPDGSKIAFAHGAGPAAEIYAINPDGSNRIQLTSNSESDAWPNWSPDGTMIAFNRAGSIWVMDADGTNQHFLTYATIDMAPSWSPDGRRIAFSSNCDIFVANVDGTNVVDITNSPDMCEVYPAWKPK